jgi:hypothetical protein
MHVKVHTISSGIVMRSITGIISLLLFLLTRPTILYADSDFSTPEKTFNTLIEAILNRERNLYVECLGRDLNEEETENINTVKKTSTMRPSSVVVKIDNVKVLKKGFEEIDIGKVFYIYSEQTWEFGDRRKEKKNLDLHFKKEGNRWIFVPIKGQSFLFQ